MKEVTTNLNLYSHSHSHNHSHNHSHSPTNPPLSLLNPLPHPPPPPTLAPPSTASNRLKKTQSDGYYQTAALLTASEEISLGTSVSHLIKLNEIYWTLLSNTTNLSVEDWAKAAGYWDDGAVPSLILDEYDMSQLLPKRHQTYTGRDVQSPIIPIEPRLKERMGDFREFVEVVEVGKRARKRMVEANMRLVISIGERNFKNAKRSFVFTRHLF